MATSDSTRGCTHLSGLRPSRTYQCASVRLGRLTLEHAVEVASQAQLHLLVARLQPDIADEEFEPTIGMGGAPASTAQYYLSWTDGGARRFPDSYPLSFNHRQVLLEAHRALSGQLLAQASRRKLVRPSQRLAWRPSGRDGHLDDVVASVRTMPDHTVRSGRQNFFPR